MPQQGWLHSLHDACASGNQAKLLGSPCSSQLGDLWIIPGTPGIMQNRDPWAASNAGSSSRSWPAIRVQLPGKPGAPSTHPTGSGMQPLLSLTGHWDPSHSQTTKNYHPKTASKDNASRVSLVMVLSQHPQVSSTHLFTLIPVLKANVLGRGSHFRSTSPLLVKSPELRKVGGGTWRTSQAPRSSTTK